MSGNLECSCQKCKDTMGMTFSTGRSYTEIKESNQYMYLKPTLDPNIVQYVEEKLECLVPIKKVWPYEFPKNSSEYAPGYVSPYSQEYMNSKFDCSESAKPRVCDRIRIDNEENFQQQ